MVAPLIQRPLLESILDPLLPRMADVLCFREQFLLAGIRLLLSALGDGIARCWRCSSSP